MKFSEMEQATRQNSKIIDRIKNDDLKLILLIQNVILTVDIFIITYT